MGLFSGWSLKNPLQPLTHGIGKTVGVTANTKTGVKLDPKKLLLDAAVLALPGVGSALGAIPGIGGALAGASGAVSGAIGGLGSAASGALGGLPGGASTLGPLLSALGMGGGGAGGAGGGGGSSLDTLLKLGAGGAGVYNAVEANKLRSKALDQAQTNYDARAPLRTQGLAKMTGAARPDLSRVFTSQTNPFAQGQAQTRYRPVGG